MSRTKTADPAATITQAQTLAEQAHEAAGRANLVRDELYLARQDASVSHARALLDGYRQRQQELLDGERQAEREFTTAVRDGRWPAPEWVAWRAFWHRRNALTDAAISAASALAQNHERHEAAPSTSLTLREWNFAADVNAVLVQQAVAVGADLADQLDEQRQAAFGALFAPTRPGNWEEWTTEAPDGRLLRVEKNNTTGEMIYTVLREAPTVDEPGPDAAA